MNVIPKRIAVYTQDVVNITGKKPRTARRLLARIRVQCEKEPDAIVTIYEFCEKTGFKVVHVEKFLL